MSRRVLVLTSDTGGGHRSVSNALIAAAGRHPERDLELVDFDPFVPMSPDLLEEDAVDSLAPFDRLVGLYSAVIIHAPWLWGWAFRASDNALGLRVFLALYGGRVRRRIETAIERLDADAVVSVHPLVNHVVARARARLGRPRMPLTTVITDLVDVHRWWVTPEVDQYVVGSDIAAGRLLDLGIPPHKVNVLGIPIRAEFGATNVAARDMRRRLGLDEDLATILLMGGGAGAGRLPQTARAIAGLAGRRGVPRFQLVILTGRNRRARIDLEAQRWPVPTSIYGLMSNIVDFMTAADVVVTKPGSLTVSEALAVGRPLVLGRPLPGQEEGNVPYVVDAGAGLAYRSPAEAAEAVAYLLHDPAARWEMGQRAARLSRSRAAERTLDVIQSTLLRAEVAR